MAGAPATISDNEVILRIGATERRNLRHHKSTILALKLSTFRLLLYEADCECPDCLLWVQALQHHRYDFVVQLLSCVQLFATPCTATCQASLSFTISWSLPKLIPIEWVMPCNHLILCCPFLSLPSIFPSIGVFSNESVLHIRWPKDGASASAPGFPVFPIFSPKHYGSHYFIFFVTNENIVGLICES